MDDYDIRSAASILASVKEQEARFERLTRALEEERRNVSLQLERANVPSERMSMCNIGNGQPLPTAWQQLVLQGEDSPALLVLVTFVSVCGIANILSCQQEMRGNFSKSKPILVTNVLKEDIALERFPLTSCCVSGTGTGNFSSGKGNPSDGTDKKTHRGLNYSPLYPKLKKM